MTAKNLPGQHDEQECQPVDEFSIFNEIHKRMTFLAPFPLFLSAVSARIGGQNLNLLANEFAVGESLRA